MRFLAWVTRKIAREIERRTPLRGLLDLGDSHKGQNFVGDAFPKSGKKKKTMRFSSFLLHVKKSQTIGMK